MASPKTDITQSVGRILRIKHDNPIIVDIIDSHDLYQNQWKKRKQFYKKCNYTILKTDSHKFNNENTDWTKVYESKNKLLDKDMEDEKNGFGKCLIDVSLIK